MPLLQLLRLLQLLLLLLLLCLQLCLLQLELLLLHLLCVLCCRRPARHVCCCSLPALAVRVAGPWLLQLPANKQHTTVAVKLQEPSCTQLLQTRAKHSNANKAAAAQFLCHVTIGVQSTLCILPPPLLEPTLHPLAASLTLYCGTACMPARCPASLP
jgi:hypothetical protein